MLAAVQLQPYAELIVVGYISEFTNTETLGVESSLERGSAPIAMIRDKTHEDSRCRHSYCISRDLIFVCQM